jgi:hypothetical protein
MNRSLRLVLSILFGVFILFFSGMEIYQGHASLGRHVHTTYYEKTNPQGFWCVVIFHIVVGVFLLGVGIYNFMQGDD